VLLKSLLSASAMSSFELILDIRCKNQIQIPIGAKVAWCSPSFFSRVRAEFRLRFLGSRGDVILCFHSLPPLLPSPGYVFVFVQNRLNIETCTATFDRTTLRTFFKRMLFRRFSLNTDEFVVQTQSMRLAVKRWLGSAVPVNVLPFLDAAVIDYKEVEISHEKNYDFIYVADGVTHKNHKMLIAAWVILSEEDIRPSLLLTLGDRDHLLLSEIEKISKAHGLKIYNAGFVCRERLFSLYNSAQALIFPSKIESFGIPLIEATQCGLPVIAAELDYVRDVCIPVETFNPDSPVSIARAVKRFLKIPIKSEPLISANEFLKKLIDQ